MKKFGNWTILKDLGTRRVILPSGKNSFHFVLARCKCGIEKEICLQSLKKGKTTQCRDCFIKAHQNTYTPEFRVWINMRKRCYYKKSINYKDYGGRGITVCDRWLSAFENFYKDMGPRPSRQHSIDRIDNDGNYEPGNCRWATRSEQQRNKRNKH